MLDSRTEEPHFLRRKGGKEGENLKEKEKEELDDSKKAKTTKEELWIP